MDNSFTTFEQSKFLYDLGVSIQTNFGYASDGIFYPIIDEYDEVNIPAIKLADVNQWLWEYYRIIIEVKYYGVNNIAYELKGQQIESLNKKYSMQCLHSPNEALKRGLNEVIDLINSGEIISEAERVFNDMFDDAKEYGYSELYEKMKHFKEIYGRKPGTYKYRKTVLEDFQKEFCNLY